MSLSLSLIAHNLGGRVQGNKVVAPGPEAAGHKVKWKRKRKSVIVYIGQDNDIRVNCHAGQDAIMVKDCVRRRAGLPDWSQAKRRTRPKPPLWERNQYLSEDLRIARDRKSIRLWQFVLLINDLKNACEKEADLRVRAAVYARECGFSNEALEVDT
jgi:hypothetical protein